MGMRDRADAVGQVNKSGAANPHTSLRSKEDASARAAQNRRDRLSKEQLVSSFLIAACHFSERLPED
jgi:hypothetical protein